MERYEVRGEEREICKRSKRGRVLERYSVIGEERERYAVRGGRERYAVRGEERDRFAVNGEDKERERMRKREWKRERENEKERDKESVNGNKTGDTTKKNRWYYTKRLPSILWCYMKMYEL